MRGASLVAALVATAIATITLTGCTLISDGGEVLGILQDDAASQEALSNALDELRALDGVDSASSRFLAEGPQGDEADIDVVARASSAAAELVVMAEVARAAFASPELASAVSKFSLTIGDASLLRTTAFPGSAAVLAGEVGYWRAAEVAIGAELSMLLTGDGAADYYREITPAAEPGEDSAFTESFLNGGSELLALDDESTARTHWGLPGMTASPGLPPADVFALLETIRSAFPLANPRTPSEGASVWWQGEDNGLMVIFGQDELRESDWPSAIALAQEVMAAEITGTSFFYQTQRPDFRQYRFYLDECATEVTVGADDRALVDALAAAGTPIPPPGGPGFCAPQ